MINEFEFYHGVAFARMLHVMQKEVAIKPYSPSDNAAYVVNGTIGIYVKYSTKRLSPWRFSFQQKHRDNIVAMENDLGAAFVLLVCNDDGIVILTFDEFKQVLNETQEGVEWISATRNRRQMYSIKGSDGKLGFKVGKDEFLGKLFSRESVRPAQEGPLSR